MIRGTRQLNASIVATAPAKQQQKNIRYTKPKKAKDKKKPVVDKTFKKAFYMMLPSKSQKQDISNFTKSLDPAYVIGNSTITKQLDITAQGGQANERQGNSIHMSYLKIYGTVSNLSSAQSKGMRLLVIKERNKGQLAPATLGDLFIAPTGSGAQAPSGVASDASRRINPNFYYVLYDKSFILPTNGEKALHPLKISVKINKIIKYPINNSASTVPNDGFLWFICLFHELDVGLPASSINIEGSMQLVTYFKDYRKM